ncbi:excalibur calcium-binding domain-containing protein [Corynebacterium mastitidis]|uniref:excalibur calcium-binding domain-containing protein n=1 Tax=Corynebacterium mastitidis TaxID=161890 RepID=UPI0012EA47E4|nr:excalibur calcium-binding domain-containing protein [Corynebacterium mastitidis]
MPSASVPRMLAVLSTGAIFLTACSAGDKETQPTTSSATSTTTVTSTTAPSTSTSSSAEELDASASALARQAEQLSAEAQAKEPRDPSAPAAAQGNPTKVNLAHSGSPNQGQGGSQTNQAASQGAAAQGNPTPPAQQDTGAAAEGEEDPNVYANTDIYDPNPVDAQGVPVGQLYYSNCGQAKADGALPLREGDPGYRPALDRDGDGLACEPENWPEPKAWPTPTKTPQAYSGEEIARLNDDPNIDYEPDPGVPAP